MSSPAGTGLTEVYPPQLPGAAPGTVIGAVERLNSGAEVQEVFPLIAGRAHSVALRRGERQLLRCWSPYVRLQPTVITGGNTPSIPLAKPGPLGPAQRTPGSSGWICLWEHADGHWVPRSLATDASLTWERSTRHTGPSAPPAAPDVVWALQAGGARRAPACTILPSSTEMTVRPLTSALKGALEVCPVADSGYTLLEALRTGRMHAAVAIERAWRRAPARLGTRLSLFDLAVGYLHCRRGDVDRVQQWLQNLSSVPARGEGASDVLAISAWLAHHGQPRPDSRDIVDLLAEQRTLPMAAEGLRILADAARFVARGHSAERSAPWHWLEHYLNSSAHTALTTYTAQTPDRPTRAPDRRQLPPHEETLQFKLSAADDGPRVVWEPAEALQHRLVAANALREESMRSSRRGRTASTLVIRHRDADWLWQFARQLMTQMGIQPVLFRDPHTLVLRLTPRDVPEFGRELDAFSDHTRDGRMTLSVPAAELEILDGPIYQLTTLLPDMPFGRDDA
ncbi:hypothetical protein ABT255_20510 [Streptomyces mirabilis]|uniref:hypothetical protein n=1 Tax=Streptomyces mirabilis TaxID=68239 RepID=UPI003321131A